MDNLHNAASLAKWLIKKKGVSRKTAYIIASKKYKILEWHDIQKEYQRIKPVQDCMF